MIGASRFFREDLFGTVGFILTWLHFGATAHAGSNYVSLVSLLFSKGWCFMLEFIMVILSIISLFKGKDSGGD